MLDQLRARYPIVTVIGETSFLGVSFLIEGSEDMAIAGDLAGLAAGVRRQLVVCARQAEAAWLPRESVLVPVADPGYVARLRQLTAENDELRERLLALEEEAEDRELALRGLRRDAERHLGWVAGSETAAELAVVERERALERARSAERALADAEAALRRRSMEVAALSRELARTDGPEHGPERPCQGCASGVARLRRAEPIASDPGSRIWCTEARAHTLDLSAPLLYLLASARSWRNW